jgi:hypothetical protein
MLYAYSQCDSHTPAVRLFRLASRLNCCCKAPGPRFIAEPLSIVVTRPVKPGLILCSFDARAAFAAADDESLEAGKPGLWSLQAAALPSATRPGAVFAEVFADFLTAPTAACTALAPCLVAPTPGGLLAAACSQKREPSAGGSGTPSTGSGGHRWRTIAPEFT